jgi:hypothetical protein
MFIPGLVHGVRPRSLFPWLLYLDHRSLLVVRRRRKRFGENTASSHDDGRWILLRFEGGMRRGGGREKVYFFDLIFLQRPATRRDPFLHGARHLPLLWRLEGALQGTLHLPLPCMRSLELLHLPITEERSRVDASGER